MERRGAAGRTNAPETGRPSVNNGLEVGCGTRRGGVAHAPAARAGRGAGDCASRQLLRARDRCPPRALPPMHRRCWRMPPVSILALRLRDSDIVLWPSLSWCLGVTYSVCRVVCVTMRMCSALPAARSWPQCRWAMRSNVTPPTEVIILASAPNRVCMWEHRHRELRPVTIVSYLESLVAFGKQHPKLWCFLIKKNTTLIESWCFCATTMDVALLLGGPTYTQAVLFFTHCCRF